MATMAITHRFVVADRAANAHRRVSPSPARAARPPAAISRRGVVTWPPDRVAPRLDGDCGSRDCGFCGDCRFCRGRWGCWDDGGTASRGQGTVPDAGRGAGATWGGGAALPGGGAALPGGGAALPGEGIGAVKGERVGSLLRRKRLVFAAAWAPPRWRGTAPLVRAASFPRSVVTSDAPITYSLYNVT